MGSGGESLPAMESSHWAKVSKVDVGHGLS
jgi:hypothetical protein